VHSFKFVVGCCLVGAEKEVQNRMDDRPCQQELHRNHAGNPKLSAHTRLLEAPSTSTLSVSQAGDSPVLLSAPPRTHTNAPSVSQLRRGGAFGCAVGHTAIRASLTF